jgi:membrane protein YqaA with SNARE-associated domain
LNTLKHILSRYTAFLWGLLAPLGVWGVFVIAAMDGAALGLPMDVVVAGYVYQNKSLFLVYALLAAAGSAIGSSVLYLIGYFGGEAFLRKRMSEKRFAQIHTSFDKHEFWALMFPAMLPPPTPFKLFVLSAAVFEMNFAHFLLAIFAGRFIRFFLLGLLTIQFGPEFVNVGGRVLTQHWEWIVAAVGVGLVIWLAMRRKRARRVSQVELSEEDTSATA